jgi:hypothetical protein
MKVVFCTLVLSIYSFLAKGQTQESPSFFISEKGLNVLFVEKDTADLITIKYRLVNDASGIIYDLLSSKSISAHAEGMPRIYGNTLIYEEKGYSKTNKFWSNLKVYNVDQKQENYLSPTITESVSTSFSKALLMPNGNLGVVHLAEKIGPKGRSVRFSSLANGKLQESTIVDSLACECCRTDIILKNDSLFLFYRDSQKDIRDFSYVVSADFGKTFSIPKTVFSDGWLVNACPHSGGTAVEAGGRLLYAYFTATDGQNHIRVVDIASKKLLFDDTSEGVTMPNITVNARNEAVLVYSKPQKMKGRQEFGLQVMNISTGKTHYIFEKGLVLSHPVATTFNGKCYLAFEQETANGLQKVVVKSIKL